MRRRWIVVLSVVTAVVLAVIGVFIGVQFKDPDYQPRFRLTEESDKLKSNSKEVLEMKSNLMSSIAKNCRGNLKGPIPESLEFDLSKTTDEGGKSFIKVFDVSLIEITGLKGYTYVLKETLPISKYTYHDDVQSGLLTNVPMEAILTYFNNDKIYERPVMVCPVISIDEKDFDCYVRNSDNDWSVFHSINELDPTDPEFDQKVTELINNHYNKPSSPTQTTPESVSEETPQEQPKQETEQHEHVELELSRKEGFNNDLVEVLEGNKFKIPGLKGYAHAFKKKLVVSNYDYNYQQQNGLPTNKPLDAVLVFFEDGKPYNAPLMVCPVTSAKGKQFDCYLRDSDNNWSKNDQISELNHRDMNFGQKIAKIIKDHYQPPEPTYEPEPEKTDEPVAEETPQEQNESESNVFQKEPEEQNVFQKEPEPEKTDEPVSEESQDQNDNEFNETQNASEEQNVFQKEPEPEKTDEPVSEESQDQNDNEFNETQNASEEQNVFQKEPEPEKTDEPVSEESQDQNDNEFNETQNASEEQNVFQKEPEPEKTDEPVSEESQDQNDNEFNETQNASEEQNVFQKEPQEQNVFQKEPEPEKTDEPVSEESQEQNESEDQNENESNEVEYPVPDNLEVDLSNQTPNEEGFTKLTEVEGLELPGYKGYSHLFNSSTKVNSFKYNGQQQNGLPTNTDLDVY